MIQNSLLFTFCSIYIQLANHSGSTQIKIIQET